MSHKNNHIYRYRSIAACVLCTILTQTLPAQTVSPGLLKYRQTADLNGKWQVIIDWYDKGGPEIGRNQKPVGAGDFAEFSFDDRQTLQVPGDWNSQRPELSYYEGTIWYKRTFMCTAKTGRQTWLNFSGVSSRCEVYLNGRKIGSHEGAFTAFTFNISSAVKTGSNLLVVKVNNERRDDAIPARRFDWWNYGGITRGVTIADVPDDHIADHFIQLKKGSLRQLEGWVQLALPKKQQLIIELPDAGIKKILYTDNSGRATFSIQARLKLWSPEHPCMYRVKINTAADTIEDEIGFRSIATRGRELWLNGQPVFLRGVSFHEEIPQRAGRAYSESDAAALLNWAKELGCNFVRLAHYPQSEETVRMAERLGIMLWEEIPVWQGVAFDNPSILDKANNMLREMIGRDKNRCSVIVWSIANETVPGKARNKVLTQMAAKARALDSTRLISSAFDHFTYQKDTIMIDDPLGAQLDLLAANKYLGWYTPWPSAPGNLIWKTKYNKPLIISEFGSEALYGNHGSRDTASLWTEEHQEQVYRDNIAMFRNNPWLSGVCPWVLADFRSPFRMQSQYQEGWNRKGLLSDRGLKKKAWFILHDFYEHKKPLNILRDNK